MTLTAALVRGENEATFLAGLLSSMPQYVALPSDENGFETPRVVGLARTPAVYQPGGEAFICYVHLREDEVPAWETLEGVRVLGRAPYTGLDTVDAVYADVQSRPDDWQAYTEVAARPAYQSSGEDGSSLTVQATLMRPGIA
ncbi:hypothetical protein DL237_09900 [Pseudooceanicola sediminis]|uniref:Uncharacterized protein n=1 Tax=Pseudooceanicola sediminis TaxID=2211117 RepID=A0A399J155_9RHOB|nr:hypothetical protein [Pseudooceanicola sediminis]RII38981.1 hypothetical protein DL237_09900 [Pseudooceanicola sediminis]